ADRGPVHRRMLGPGVGAPAAERGEGTTYLQERRQVGHQAAAPVAAGKAAGVTAAARKAMPWRCWPLNTDSHGRATRPGSETGAPRVSPSEMPPSGTVTLISDDSPSSM